MATISILIAFEIINFSFDAGFALWQKAIFAGTAMLFAAPTHAMVEFFSLTREMAGPIAQLSPFSNDGILPEHQSRLVSIRLRSKLFYLSIFIAGVPLVFFGVSTGFKVDHMLWTSAAAFNIDQIQMLPLWRWITGVIGVCLILSLAMIIFTAGEASRLYATLSGAMRRVRAGNLDADLHITSTDEHADLFRGFNHMIRGLREEVQLLEVTRGLAGELNLDILIQRIMSAASDLLDAERASLFVHDPKTDQLWSRYAAGLHTVAIPQESRDVTLGARGRLRRHRADEDDPAKELLQPPLDFRLEGAHRDQDCVVVVLPHGGLSLPRQNADDLKRNVPDPDHLPHRICRRTEQLVDHGLTQDRHLRAPVHVGLGEEAAPGRGPGANLEVLGSRSGDGGAPVLVLAEDLGHGPQGRRSESDSGNFVLYSPKIVPGEGWHGSKAAAGSAGGSAARHHDEKTGAHGGEGLLDPRLGSLADRHHGDHGGDADDHAQHRQE